MDYGMMTDSGIIMDPDMILLLYLCFWLALAGAAAGSFIDCAAWRWAHGEEMFKGRSKCASCGSTLSARDLVPVLSYLFMRGRCRYCKEKIPAECLIAEIGGAAAFVCFGIRFGASIELAQWIILGALLLAMSLADGAKRIIPGRILLTMTVNRVAWVFILQEPLLEAGKTALISLCAVPVPLLVLTLVMERMLGRELMGGGDIKLLAALALYLKWPQMALTLLAGCILGIAGAAACKKRGEFAFGPYLAASCIAAVCFGDPFVAWYLGFL